MTLLQINLFLSYFWQIIQNWWWIVLPFLLWKPFKFLWVWWRIDVWKSQQKEITLEIKLPKENMKPIRAMETVIQSIFGVIYQPPDWWETYFEGQIQTGISFEICANGDGTRFFLKTFAQFKEGIEAAFYSQYPDIEITQVDDYVKYVPQDIPNKNWDMWGTNYCAVGDDHMPIKTYKKFETEHEGKEEKIVDPIAMLLESMAKVRKGEQFWIQTSKVGSRSHMAGE